MLDPMRLQNVKAWREADVRLGKITGGPNNAGKSNVLQFILLLKNKPGTPPTGLGTLIR